MNACTVLFVSLLCHTPRGQADQAVHPTQDMLIGGVSASFGSVGEYQSSMSLNHKGISYLPADTFVDFPNTIVSCTCFFENFKYNL